MNPEVNQTKYILVETNSLESVVATLQPTQRIKYTCFDVSENFIVFGATSGGIYIFSRDPCYFLQLLPNKDGSLSNVSISQDEKFIGFSTCRGIAVILERSNEGGCYLVSRSEEHSAANITSLTWSDNSSKMFVADDTGRLSVINISLFINKSIFQLPSHVIINLDSEIVQVSCCGDLLLVSTRTRSYVCDTVKEQYKQIGTKLREGVFGCSFIKYSGGITKAFCARPGSRLWEVDLDGSVLCTHQFKEALSKNPSVIVSLPKNKLYKNEFLVWQDQSMNFSYLFPVMNKYLFSFKENSFCVFDPEKVELIVQCNKYSDIVDARCIGDRIYMWNSKGYLREFTLTPVENCLVNLYFRGSYSLCVELCENFICYIENLEYNKLVMMSPLLGLPDHIDNLHLNYNLSSFFINLNNCCNKKNFKFNLNNILEVTIKKPENCDKSNGIFTCNNLISPTSKVAINNISFVDELETNLCVHNNFEYKKHNSILHRDNNIHSNGIMVDSSSTCYSSDTSNSPEVALTCDSLSDLSNSSVQYNKINARTAKYKDKFVIKIKDSFKDRLQPPKNSLDKMKNHALDSKDIALLNITDSDESVVDSREINKKNGVQIPAMDISPLINICDTICKSEKNCCLELFAQFLQNLNLVYYEYIKRLDGDQINKTKCYFPLSKYLSEERCKVFEQYFYDIIYSGELVKCLKLLLDKVPNLNNTNMKYPDKLLGFFSDSELELDIVLSNTIFMIIDILNPFVILQLINCVNLPCSFLSWYSIVSFYQQHSFQQVTFPQELNSFSHWPLPVILNMIFLMLRLDQVESACYISKEVNISIKDVCYLNYRLHLHLDPSDSEDDFFSKTNNLFLHYLANLIKSNENSTKELSCETVRYIENILEEVCEPIVCDNCTFPVLVNNSNSLLETIGVCLFDYYINLDSPYIIEFRACDTKLIDDCGEQSFHTDQEVENGISDSEQFFICKKIPLKTISKVTKLIKALPRIVLKLIESNYCEVVELLEFIAQFNLLHYIESNISELCSQDWIKLCECYKKLSEGICCVCHHDTSLSAIDVDWNTLANFILQALGPDSSIQILINYSSFISPGKLYLSFYRSALLSHLLCRNADKTIYADILKSYHCQFVKEPIDSQLSRIGVVSLWEAESNEIAPGIVYSKDKKHWGITIDVNDDVCSKCSVVLNSEILLGDGIRGFKCGHTYHVICLRLCNSLFQCSICS